MKIKGSTKIFKGGESLNMDHESLLENNPDQNQASQEGDHIKVGEAMLKRRTVEAMNDFDYFNVYPEGTYIVESERI